MSEYQFVHFMALDQPLNDEQLRYMRSQSSRAKITRWDFTNEYHWGDFHGRAAEMLRRGYDVHLHYASYGIRRLMFRLPGGLPCDRRTFERFQADDGIGWRPNKRGPGGILEIEPKADADNCAETLVNVADVLPEVAPVRDMLIAGDLRPLYLAWLACQFDPDAIEPPVPAGLGKLPRPLAALAKFYETSEDLIAAAAERSPPMTASTGDDPLGRWIAKRSKADLQQWLKRLLLEESATVKGEIISQVRAATPMAVWPLAEPSRSAEELESLAKDYGERRQREEQATHDAARRKRLKAIAANPDKTIAKVHSLANGLSTSGYDQAAQELADLREALGPAAGPKKAGTVARQLRKKYPTRRHLISALRRAGFLD